MQSGTLSPFSRLVIICMVIPWLLPVPAGKARDMSLNECIVTALENNADLLVSRLDQDSAESAVDGARAQYDPTFTAGVDYTNNRTQQSFADLVLGGSETASMNMGLGAYLPSGTTVSVSLDNRAVNTQDDLFRDETTYNSSLSLAVSQPLLKNAGREVVKAPITIARRNLEITNEQIRGTVHDVIALVESSYWDLVYARGSLDVARDSRELAAQQLERTRSLIATGKIAGIELLGAEATVVSREEDILLAEQVAMEAEDALKQVLWLQPTETQWALPLDLTDLPPSVATPDLNEQGLTGIALEHRPDLARLRVNMALRELDLTTARNAAKPSLTASANVAVSGYQDDFSGNMEQMARADLYSLGVGLDLSTPWHNRSGRSNRDQAVIRLEQAKLQLKKMETTITAQVRSAVRSVRTADKRIEASSRALDYARRRLEAEERRFELGRSTSIDVADAQDQLTISENAVLKAIIDHTKALTNLRKVTGTSMDGYTMIVVDTIVVPERK
ncbi:TolC family protein [bacterium]|nr:TolC family protein [candidate division CSSED10-310 bacterium]